MSGTIGAFGETAAYNANTIMGTSGSNSTQEHLADKHALKVYRSTYPVHHARHADEMPGTFAHELPGSCVSDDIFAAEPAQTEHSHQEFSEDYADLMFDNPPSRTRAPRRRPLQSMPIAPTMLADYHTVEGFLSLLEPALMWDGACDEFDLQWYEDGHYYSESEDAGSDNEYEPSTRCPTCDSTTRSEFDELHSNAGDWQ